MFALKAVPRLTTASSQLPKSSILRYLSTEASQPDAAGDVHQTQGKERQRSIRKVSEEGGAHSQLVALAVKNTAARQAGSGSGGVSKEQRLAQAKRELERRKAEQSEAGPKSPSSSSNQAPRNNNRNQPRSTAGGGGSPAISDSLALLRGNAQQRPFNPRFPSSNENRGPRPPRRNSPPSSSSASSSSPKSKSKQPRRQSKSSSSSSSGSIFSAEDTKPLVPPPQVAYPSINLAQLLRADLAAKTLQVKQSVDTATKNSELDENSEDPKVREQTRKVLNGDYSQWTQQVGGNGKRGKEALEHARNLLARNPSVGLKGREVFINKLKEAL